MNERTHSVTLTGTELVVLESIIQSKISSLEFEFSLTLNSDSKEKKSLLNDINFRLNYLQGLLSKIRGVK